MDMCKKCKLREIDYSRSKSKCTECLEVARIKKNEYYKKHSLKIISRQKEYYHKNREVLYRKSREYIKQNPDKNKRYQQKYYLTHKDKIKKYVRENLAKVNLSKTNWAKSNPERVKEIRKGVHLRRRDKAREERRKRRAIKASAYGNFTEKEWLKVLEDAGNCCIACGSNIRMEADHVVPISRGGDNTIENIQPLCLKCNRSKHTKIIDFRPFGRAVLDWT